MGGDEKFETFVEHAFALLSALALARMWGSRKALRLAPPNCAIHFHSGCTPQEKVDAVPELPPRLRSACDALYGIALQAGAAQAAHGLQLVPDEFAGSVLKFGLVEVRVCGRG